MSTGWAFGRLSRFSAAAGGASDGFGLTPTGGVATVAGDAAVRQAILILLATRPGERVMRPHYGCPLHRLVFSPNDTTTAGLAIHYVRQALRRFEPRVEIVRLDAGAAPERDPTGTVLFVTLDYRVRATQTAERLVVALDLADGGS